MSKSMQPGDRVEVVGMGRQGDGRGIVAVIEDEKIWIVSPYATRHGTGLEDEVEALGLEGFHVMPLKHSEVHPWTDHRAYESNRDFLEAGVPRSWPDGEVSMVAPRMRDAVEDQRTRRRASHD